MMTTIRADRIGMIARTYWQPLVLILLGMVALSQLLSWGMAYAELKKVDRLIAQTEQTDPPVTNSSSSGSPHGSPVPPGNTPQKKKPVKNIFRRDNTKYQLTAIYMDKAVINGKVVKVGDRVGKAIVQKIGTSTVTVQVEGQDHPRTLEMFKGGAGGPPGPMRGFRGPRRILSRKNTKKETGSAPPPGKDLSPPKGHAPPSVMDGNIFERIRNMSREERRAFFQNLTPEQREELRRRARERFRGPGGRRGGGPRVIAR